MDTVIHDNLKYLFLLIIAYIFYEYPYVMLYTAFIFLATTAMIASYIIYKVRKLSSNKHEEMMDKFSIVLSQALRQRQVNPRDLLELFKSI